MYKAIGVESFIYQKIEIGLPPIEMFEIKLSPDRNIKSPELAILFLEEVNKLNSVDLKSIMSDQFFDIVYSDRYLKSPFSCLLLVQFIAALKKKFNFTLGNLNVEVEDFYEERNPIFIYQNYLTSFERNDELKSFAKNNGIENININIGKRPHYRYFEFKNKQLSIIIRPDAGIEHGWRCVSNKNYSNLTGNEIFEMWKYVNYPILYTVVIEQNQTISY